MSFRAGQAKGPNVRNNGSGPPPVQTTDSLLWYVLSGSIVAGGAGPFHINPQVGLNISDVPSPFTAFPMGFPIASNAEIVGISVLFGTAQVAAITSAAINIYEYPVPNFTQRPLNAGTLVATINCNFNSAVTQYYTRFDATLATPIPLTANKGLFCQLGPIQFFSALNDCIVVLRVRKS